MASIWVAALASIGITSCAAFAGDDEVEGRRQFSYSYTLTPRLRNEIYQGALRFATQLAEVYGQTQYKDTPVAFRGTEMQRSEMQAALVDEQYLANFPYQQDRIVYLVTGIPGSGKTSRLGKPLRKAFGGVDTNPDIARREIPEYLDGAGGAIVHAEASHISKLVKDRAIGTGDNIVMQFVGRKPEVIATLIKQFKEAGYTIHLRQVDLDADVAKVRLRAEQEKTGHLVFPDFVDASARTTSEAFMQFENHPDIASAVMYGNRGGPEDNLEIIRVRGTIPERERTIISVD